MKLPSWLLDILTNTILVPDFLLFSDETTFHPGCLVFSQLSFWLLYIWFCIHMYMKVSCSGASEAALQMLIINLGGSPNCIYLTAPMRCAAMYPQKQIITTPRLEILQGVSKKSEFSENQLWLWRTFPFERLNSNSRIAFDHQIVIIIIKRVFGCRTAQTLLFYRSSL